MVRADDESGVQVEPMDVGSPEADTGIEVHRPQPVRRVSSTSQ